MQMRIFALTFLLLMFYGGHVSGYTSGLRKNRMSSNLASIGTYKLKNLCMPGSHDAGTSRNLQSTSLGKNCVVLTQQSNIYVQLYNGVRYFDIRIIIGSGQYHTGHYGYVPAVDRVHGGRGESISNIIYEINEFTSRYNELIILKFSHDFQTDEDYQAFNQEQWNGLYKQLLGINHRLHIETNDLTDLQLNAFIGNGKPAVIIIITPKNSDMNLGSFDRHGFYLSRRFPLYDEYSNSNNLATMQNDQIKKMQDNRIDRNSKMFLLSWTLTQSDTDATLCPNLGNNILELAKDANSDASINYISGKITKDSYPNIVYTDIAGGVRAMTVCDKVHSMIEPC